MALSYTPHCKPPATIGVWGLPKSDHTGPMHSLAVLLSGAYQLLPLPSLHFWAGTGFQNATKEAVRGQDV
jgi:hypothetical protein